MRGWRVSVYDVLGRGIEAEKGDVRHQRRPPELLHMVTLRCAAPVPPKADPDQSESLDHDCSTQRCAISFSADDS